MRLWRALLSPLLLCAATTPTGAAPLTTGRIHRVARPAPRAYPVRGALSAPINILYWSPFRSGTTARVQAALRALLARHPGQIRLQWMPRYRTGSYHSAVDYYAAQVGMEAFAQGGDALFWAFHDALCKHPNLYRLTAAEVDRTAAQVGLSMRRLRVAVVQDLHARRLARSQRLLARLGVRAYYSGPVLLLGTRIVYPGGAPSPAYLDSLVAAERKRIARWQRAGLSGDALHARALRAAMRRYQPAPSAQRTGVRHALSPRRRALPVHNSPVRGPAAARVTLVAFLDFVDYRSYRLWRLLERARTRYRGRVRIVLKTLPRMTYSRSLVAAKALHAAHAVGRAWDMARVLFQMRYAIRASRLLQIARRAGLPTARFRRAVLSAPVRRQVLRDVALARKVGLVRAPALFVNGRKLRGRTLREAVFWAVLRREARGGLLSRYLSP